MDFYKTLGVAENASQDDIKKAYRKLAAKHHPDRGGDTAEFQKISQAYDTIGDETKRAQYDAQKDGVNTNNFHFNSGSFDPFNNMFGGQSPFEQFFRHGNNQRRKNRDLSIRCKITFKQSYTGADLEANYKLPSGKDQTVLIQVPQGIIHGQTIRYSGMGDDSIAGLPKGDLNVTVLVEPDPNYERKGDDLITFVKINAIEAMTGCTKIVKTLGDASIRFNIKPGAQYGTEYQSIGYGFKRADNRQTGNLNIVVLIDVPAITDPAIKEELEKIYAKISNPPQ
jgi:curved DNA-binding protein